MKKIIENEAAIAWMQEHASEYTGEYPVRKLANAASNKFAEDQGLGWNGEYTQYLYYHQAAEVFFEQSLSPGKNDISHHANYVNDCTRYH